MLMSDKFKINNSHFYIIKPETIQKINKISEKYSIKIDNNNINIKEMYELYNFTIEDKELFTQILNKIHNTKNNYSIKNSTDFECLVNKLDENKYEKFIKVLNEAISKKKYTLNLKDSIEEIKERLKKNNIIEEIFIEETIKEIEDNNLENELDLQCERYNKYTTNNPAEYISYNVNKKRYVLYIPKEKEKSSNKLDTIINTSKENLCRQFEKKLSNLSALKKNTI
jgi:flagellar biosynthesis chaperone FliJ